MCQFYFDWQQMKISEPSLTDLAFICSRAGFLTSLGSFKSLPFSESIGMAPGVRQRLPLPTLHRFRSRAVDLSHDISRKIDMTTQEYSLKTTIAFSSANDITNA